MQERTWERIVKQAGSVPSTAFGSVLESGSEVYMGAYSECTWERLASVLGSV